MEILKDKGLNLQENKTEIKFTYSWDYSDMLGKFKMNCPNCGNEISTDVQSIDESFNCEKCNEDYIIRRKTWIEIIQG